MSSQRQMVKVNLTLTIKIIQKTFASQEAVLVYRIYPCTMRIFFPLEKLRKLRCVLNTESFVLDSRPSLACKQINKIYAYTNTQSFAFNWKLKTEPMKK